MKNVLIIVVSVVVAIVAFNLMRYARAPRIAPQPNPAPHSVNLRDVQSSAQYAKGQQLFLGVCTLCHMEQGEGQPGMVPTLHGAPIATGDVGAFARILLHGMEGPVVVKGVTYNGIMPPATFDSDEDLAAVMTFVRNSWGNAAGPVTPEQVTKVKQDTAGRKKPWTAAELRP
ncbi:MAG TPA: cytochrome c [Phycisphaerales bacterium]|nr:cytochrome c [Phycisphaerales bacterium]